MRPQRPAPIGAWRIEIPSVEGVEPLRAVLELLGTGRLDPSPLVTAHMPLSEAPEAYRRYAAREALKIVLTP